MPEKKPRSWQQKGFVPFRLEVLTPVFIGSGQSLSPLDYVIHKKDGRYALHLVDLQSWLMQHGNEPDVRQKINSGDVAQIKRLLNEKVDVDQFSLSESPIDDATLVAELQQAYGGSKAGSGFHQKDKTGVVAAALRNPANGELYIPGSSLKGAISTPIIDVLDKWGTARNAPSLKEIMKSDKRGSISKGLEAMFGKIGEHAMQALKVSDVATPPGSCAIVRAKEISRKPDKKGTPKDPCEVIMPGCGDMWGRFMLDVSGGTPAVLLKNGTKLELPTIVKCCNGFYFKRFREEMGKFYQLAHFRKTREALAGIEEKLCKLEQGAILLRVGHYSHVECVTVENNKPFTSKGQNGKPKPYGTTRTLASGVLPFGWVLLHPCTLEAYEEGISKLEDAQLARMQAHTSKMLSVRREAEKAAEREAALKEERERKLKEEEEKKQKERERQEELAKRMAQLSPEEAVILQLMENPDEALSMKLFADMQNWPSDMQGKAAKALKDCWGKMGKWNGKQSKKQQSKIQLVRKILGE